MDHPITIRAAAAPAGTGPAVGSDRDAFVQLGRGFDSKKQHGAAELRR
jgi:hypothetical protein